MSGKAILVVLLSLALMGLLAIATAGSVVLAINLQSSKSQLRRAEMKIRELEERARQAEAKARAAGVMIPPEKQFADLDKTPPPPPTVEFQKKRFERTDRIDRYTPKMPPKTVNDQF